MTDNTREDNAIIQAQPKQLTVRHTWLVERGLHSLHSLGITESRIKELCSALYDFDFDIRAKTLKTIADIGPHIRSCRRYVDSLIFPIVENMYRYFGPELTVGYLIQLELFAHGQHYPPRGEYLKLLLMGVQSLIGTVKSPDEAIMDVLFYGTSSSKVHAVEWLADHQLTANTHELFSDYVRNSLLSTANMEPLFLALKYADAVINDHFDEATYFFIDEIILKNIPVELKAKAREYILFLQEETSQKALIYSFSVLAESGDTEDKKYAYYLFDEVMTRDLGEYSDDDLKLICRFCSWLSDEQGEVCEYKEDVMEELRRRGLEW